MENIFIKILNQSIAAGWLIIAIIILRMIFKRYTKTLLTAFWAVAALRLVLPFSVKSVFSLIPNAATVPETILYDNTPHIDSGVYFINHAVNPAISQSLSPSPGNSVNPAQILLYFASAVWIIGVIAILCYMIVSSIILKVKLKTATYYTDGVCQSDRIKGPFVFGFISPKIYLPYNLNDSYISFVLRHEKKHIERKDHIIRPLAFLLLAFYWFNPLVWAAYILFCRDTELACDESVIKDMNVNERAEYSSALLNCSAGRPKTYACPLAFNEIGVKARIKNIIKYKRPAIWISVLAIMMCLAVAGCFLTDPVQKNAESENIEITNIHTGNEKIKFKVTPAPAFGNATVFNAKWINNSKDKIIFGEEFHISKTENNEVIPCDMRDNTGWTTPAYTLFPGGSFEKEYSVSFYYDISAPGKYRLETDYSFESDKNTKVPVYVDFEVKNIASGEKTYIYKDSSDIIKPNLTLNENGEFTFFYSALSSYYAIGKYTLEEDLLTCKTQDGLYTYVFHREGESFIFDEKQSSDIPYWNFSSGDKNNPAPCVPDRAVFS